jgi:hypothetical protein
VGTKRWLLPLLVACLPLGCDDEGDSGDSGSQPDVPEVVEGCPNGDALVAIGETRSCVCDDGTDSEQTCLSTGEYAECQCIGGGW